MKRILNVQKQIGALSKKSENPFFKSAYLDLNDLLNAVKPLLEAEGLILMQPLKDNTVGTSIFAESGELLASSYLKIPESITDPQKIGSCITYFRRYTLKSLLAIAEKDDDGELAAKPEPKERIILTEEQFKVTMKSDAKGIANTLKAYDTKLKGMTQAHKLELENQLEILKLN